MELPSINEAYLEFIERLLITEAMKTRLESRLSGGELRTTSLVRNGACILDADGLIIEEALTYLELALRFELSSDEIRRLTPRYQEALGLSIKSSKLDRIDFDVWWDGKQFVLHYLHAFDRYYRGTTLLEALENAGAKNVKGQIECPPYEPSDVKYR